jgi:polysaccharide pyruvyl transferase WcaK-like protein
MSGEKCGVVSMVRNKPLFILAGICPYENRGCEAIVRGTVKILRNYFHDPSFLCLGFSKMGFEQQCREEYDDKITHKKLNPVQNKYGREWWIQRVLYRYNTKKRNYRLFKDMMPYLDDAIAVLSVGGDNYSLDYGIPQRFTLLDDIVLEKKKPLILWGASIGPFDAMPDYERYMIDHLGKVTGIFARESATVDYLTRHGVTANLQRVADPAFLMDPAEPQGEGKQLVIEKDAIGINLSPLMAKYVTGGDLSQWEQIAATMIRDIAVKTSRPIYLVPHVTLPGSNDFTFLEKARNIIESDSKKEISLIPPIYNAAETKWIISHLSLFAGARTHATIAALSSCIPTLSFSYSIKAKGINRDIFGHEGYCLSPDQLTPELVSSKIEEIFRNKNQIQTELNEKIPLVQASAMNAGKYLIDLVSRT